MLFESDKETSSLEDEQQNHLIVRSLKPKLISTLNYQQEYLMRRKKKRNKQRQNNPQKMTSSNNFNKMSFNQLNTETFVEDYNTNNFFKQVFDGNDKIIGNWINGLLEGQAEIHYQNGDLFKGVFEKGYKIAGKMIFKDQGSYEGEFYNQLFHGKGVLRLKDKTITAVWVNGIAENNCIVKYDKGNLYYGPLKQFKKHGYGYLYFTNDTKFFGQFVQGHIKGYGEFYEKGKIKCKGIWSNGKLVKQSKQQDSSTYQDELDDWKALEEIFSMDKIDIASCFMLLGKQGKIKSNHLLEESSCYSFFNQNSKEKNSQQSFFE